MESRATKIQSFEEPVKIMVEYEDGDINYILNCTSVHLKDDLLRFEMDNRDRMGHRIRCFALDEVYRYVIFSPELGRKERFVGRKNVPTFHWKK